MNIPAPEGYQAEAHYYDRCGWKVAAKPNQSLATSSRGPDCGYIGHADSPNEELIQKGKEKVSQYILLGMVK